MSACDSCAEIHHLRWLGGVRIRKVGEGDRGRVGDQARDGLASLGLSSGLSRLLVAGVVVGLAPGPDGPQDGGPAMSQDAIGLLSRVAGFAPGLIRLRHPRDARVPAAGSQQRAAGELDQRDVQGPATGVVRDHAP